MKSERLSFRNKGGAVLGARLDLPDRGEASEFALFAHCFTCTKNLKSIGNINERLTESGIGVLRFDFTGLGDSEGDFSSTNFTTNVEDLQAAADFLTENYGSPALLIGHSLGGAAVLQAAGSVSSTAAVVTINAPCDTSHVIGLLGEAAVEAERDGEAPVRIGPRSFKITRQFIRNLEQTRMQEIIGGLDSPILVLHAPEDDTVGIKNGYRIFELARGPRSFISLNGADHLLLNERDSSYAGDLIAVWARRYLSLS